MSMLDGFSIIDAHEKPPVMRVDSRGVTFEASVAEELGNPQKVFVLVDDRYKRFAIQSCSADEQDERAMDFWSPEDMPRERIRWKTKVLAQRLAELGNLDLEKQDYEVKGYLLEDEDAMFFDLNTVSAIPKKK